MARKNNKNTATNLTAVPNLETTTPWGNAPRTKISLDDIAAAGPNGIYTSADVHNPFVAEGLVEVNRSMANAAGELATRITPKGIAHMTKNSAVAVAPVVETDNYPVEEPAEATAEEYPDPVYPEDTAEAETEEVVEGLYVIEENIPLPESTSLGKRGRKSHYPFPALQVGQSFFVPATKEKPNQAKQLASTVSAAIARYSEEVPGQFRVNKKGERVAVTKATRNFVIRNITENGVVTGARIWRTA